MGLPGSGGKGAFTQVRAALDALEGLRTPGGADEAHELALLCAREGLDESADALERWRRTRLRGGVPRRVGRVPSP